MIANWIKELIRHTGPISPILIAVAGIFAFAGCSGGSSSSDDVFVFARGSDAQKLDPADIDDGESANTVAQICEGLVRFKSGTLEIEPCLAESYTISDDGLIYRFKLRPNVRFHDGTPLNAETALFTFQRQMDPSHPGHLKEASFSYWKYLYQDIDSVEAEGDMALKFTLSKPNASLLNSLAVFPAYLVSPQALETHGANFQRHPVGTGPFRFVEWRPSQAILMERNDDYWGEKPTLKRIVMSVSPDNTVRLLKLKAGDIQGMDGLQPAELAALKDDPNVEVFQEAGLNVGYLVFNLDRDRMANRELREAIALAIARETLAKVALSGAGRVAHYPIPKGFLGYPEIEETIPLNVEKAKEIIAAHPEWFTEPLELQVLNAPRQYFPDPVTIATFIRGQLEAVGIPVRVISKDFKAHLSDLRNGDFEMGLIGWVGDNGDTDNFLSVFFASWAAEKGTATNYSFYRNPEMDRLLLAGRSETDPQLRSVIYGDVLKQWRRDLPLLPLVHGDNIVVLRSGYEGFELQNIGDLRLGWIRKSEE